MNCSSTALLRNISNHILNPALHSSFRPNSGYLRTSSPYYTPLLPAPLSISCRNLWTRGKDQPLGSNISDDYCFAVPRILSSQLSTVSSLSVPIWRPDVSIDDDRRSESYFPLPFSRISCSFPILSYFLIRLAPEETLPVAPVLFHRFNSIPPIRKDIYLRSTTSPKAQINLSISQKYRHETKNENKWREISQKFPLPHTSFV